MLEAGLALFAVVALAWALHDRRRVRRLQDRNGREAAKREAQLLQAVARWQDAARALPDGVVMLDGDRIAWCNDTATLHLELDPAKDEGRTIAHLVRAPQFAEYLRQGDFSRPIQVRSGIGGERILSLQVIPYGGSQRLLLSRDITQLEYAERVRREFVANVSHELRTPLTVVSGFIETLREEPHADARLRYLDLMEAQANRMLRLVEDLLTLSSLESSPPPAMDETVDMQAMVQRLAADARALSGGRHRITAEVRGELDVLGSEKELASAFGNLVSNAIRYTPEGGEVRLLWQSTADGAAFEVADTGIGISAEHIPRLADRFYRVDRGRSRESGGTGLGLAIVKHALQRHGARLQVASHPGKGSTFSAQFSGLRLRPRRQEAGTG